jgi:putative copper resistance protein D
VEGPGWLLLRGFARGLHMAGAFGVFGTALLTATLLHRRAVAGLKRLALASLALAWFAGAAWFLLQTADFAAATSMSDVISALPIVAQDTRFGALLLGRCAALAAATACLWVSPRLAAALAGGAIIAEAWLGHGGAMTGTIGALLLVTSIAHIAAAAAWLGSLPALYLALKQLPDAAAKQLAQNFSPLGIACVAGLILTAAIQYTLLIARPAALFSSAYGLTATAKILGLTALIALAIRNSTRLVPALPANRPKLLSSVRNEILLAILILLAAGLILQLEPPTMAAMAGP